MLPLELGYGDAALPVRSDITEAHRRVWAHIARPGAWWTGAERVEIASVARGAWSCSLCKQRKAAVSPYAVRGTHDPGDELPHAVVDAVHRIVTDPGRLSRRAYDDILATGITDAQYVELVGVVVRVITVDLFCRAMSTPIHPLPSPKPGQPSFYRPPGAVDEGAWVPTIPGGRARGSERDLYPSRHAANVARALSLVPDEVRILHPLAHAQYVPGERTVDTRFSPRALGRVQMELVAGRVSALGECFY